MQVFIIAEAGINHNGNFENAKKLVDVAVDCGANAVKFQTFKAYESNSLYTKKAKYQQENTSKLESQYEMVKKLEFPFNYFKKLQHYCNYRNIVFISTPDGKESLNYLVSINVPLIKISSTDVTNIEFLKEVGCTMKPIILSTGMSTLGEVETAINTIISTGNLNLTLLHCTTDYPTSYEDINLKAMLTMKYAFNLPVGFSDHSLTSEAAVAAVALGAKVIEKHITLDKNMDGPDHKASMSPYEFKHYVTSIRNTEKLLGDGKKSPTKREKIMMKQVRRGIVAKLNIKAGTFIERNMLAYKRPCYGIKPEFTEIIVGRVLKKDVMKDEPILWKDV